MRGPNKTKKSEARRRSLLCLIAKLECLYSHVFGLELNYTTSAAGFLACRGQVVKFSASIIT
jgi:hypothetical protein